MFLKIPNYTHNTHTYASSINVIYIVGFCRIIYTDWYRLWQNKKSQICKFDGFSNVSLVVIQTKTVD